MTLTVLQPKLSLCPTCGYEHLADQPCDLSADEFNRRFLPGTPVLYWLSTEEDPREGRTLTQAYGHTTHVQDADGERHLILLNRLIPCSDVADISAEIPPDSLPESDAVPVTQKTPPTTKRRTATRKGTTRRTDPPHESTNGSPAAATRQLLEVPIGDVQVDRNDRTTFDSTELESFARSISELGIISPLDVSPNADGTYQLIAGERRLRAAKIAKLKTVPVLVQESSPLQRSLRQLDENLQRVDLNPVERAAAIKHRMEEFGLTQKEMADRLNVTQAQISNQIGLLELPDIWQQWVAADKLAATAVRPLRPWAKSRPQVLQSLVDKFATDIDEGNFDLTERRINEAIEECTRSVLLSTYNEWSAPRVNDCHFRYDVQKHADLDVEELKISWRPEKRAWNVELWSELNAEPLKKRRKKFKAVRDAKRGEPKTSKEATKSGDPKPWCNDVSRFETLLTKQLLRSLADQLPAKHKHGQQQLLMYIGMTEISCNMQEVANDMFSAGHSLPQMILQLSQRDAKQWPGILYDLLTGTLRQQADQHWMSEGLDTADLVVDVAQLFFEIDLLASWTPEPDQLEMCSDDWLRECGETALKLPPDQQPEQRDSVLDWLEVDWPEGFVPAEVRKMVQR